MDTIYKIIKKQESKFLSGTPIKLGKYATYNHLETISTIQAYINSQYTTGKFDSKGREKPFMNIVVPSINVWYKATDIDEKDIKFRPSKASQRIKAFIATILLRNWMRGQTKQGRTSENFGLFLDQWGYTLSAYGSAVAKFVEKDKKLIPSIISWDRIICDPVDFDAAPKIEKIYYTPDELINSNYDPEAVQRVLQLHSKKDIRTTLDNQPIDLSDEYIGVYELHGMLPLSYLTDRESDSDIYQQQMHVVFIKKGYRNKDNVEITLYRGREEKDPYMISHLIKQEGRVMGIGAVEYLLDTQWMVNHSIKNAKDQLDLASKTLNQTSDANFLGRNTIEDMDVGDILITDDDRPLIPVNNQATAVSYLINFAQQWKENGKDITGAYEAISGANLPSGTPYRLGAIQNIEAHNLFEVMKKSKSLYLERMLRSYVLPYFKKLLKTTDEVVVALEGNEIQDFDKMALPAQLAQELKVALMAKEMPTLDELIASIQEKNSLLGQNRALVLGENQTWADYFGDLDMDAIEIDIAGENRNKAEAFSIINGILQLIIQNPNALNDTNVRNLLNWIMDEAGYISPLQFTPAQPAQPSQNIQTNVGGGTNALKGMAGLNMSPPTVPGVEVLPK